MTIRSLTSLQGGIYEPYERVATLTRERRSQAREQLGTIDVFFGAISRHHGKKVATWCEQDFARARGFRSSVVDGQRGSFLSTHDGAPPVDVLG